MHKNNIFCILLVGDTSLQLLALQCLVAWVHLGHTLAKGGHAVLRPYSIGEPGTHSQVSEKQVLKSCRHTIVP